MLRNAHEPFFHINVQAREVIEEGGRVYTCELNKANPFDYLTELQKHSEQLKQKPSEWMPWNYRETLARLATPAAA